MTFEEILTIARVYMNREPTADELVILKLVYNAGYVAAQIEYVPFVEDVTTLLDGMRNDRQATI